MFGNRGTAPATLTNADLSLPRPAAKTLAASIGDVVMLLEVGCTTAEVQAITGQSMQMVEHYAKQVNQKKLAAAAILKWENAPTKCRWTLSTGFRVSLTQTGSRTGSCWPIGPDRDISLS
jgi:hypothetical protein